MREVKSGDVHTSIDHGNEVLDTPARGSEGTNNLGLSARHIVVPMHVGKIDRKHCSDIDRGRRHPDEKMVWYDYDDGRIVD
jgi:hypothetical protein